MREWTDAQRLDWLDRNGNGQGWLCRESTTGRGLRLHNAERQDAKSTVREAIDAAINANWSGS